MTIRAIEQRITTNVKKITPRSGKISNPFVLGHKTRPDFSSLPAGKMAQGINELLAAKSKSTIDILMGLGISKGVKVTAKMVKDKLFIRNKKGSGVVKSFLNAESQGFITALERNYSRLKSLN